MQRVEVANEETEGYCPGSCFDRRPCGNHMFAGGSPLVRWRVDVLNMSCCSPRLGSQFQGGALQCPRKHRWTIAAISV